MTDTLTREQEEARTVPIRVRGRAETRASRRRGWMLMAPLYALLGVLVLLPIGMVLYSAFTDVPFLRSTDGAPGFSLSNLNFLFSPNNLSALGNSIVLGLGGTAMALVWGVGLAWLAARTNVPGRWLAQLSGILPFFISSLVGALAWSSLAAPDRGYLNLLLTTLGLPAIFDIYSMGGMIFVSGLYYAPYAFLLVYGPLTLMNPELEEAAEVHGATKLSVMRKVTLPLVLPSIIGAALLVFVLIIENFVIATMLGSPGKINTLPLFIYRLMNEAPARTNEAAAVGILLVAIVALVLYLQFRVMRNKSFATVSGKGMRPKRIDIGGWRWVGFGFVALYTLLALIVPLVAIIQMALRSHSFIPDFAALFDTSAISLVNFERVFSYDEFWNSLGNSGMVAIGTVLVGGTLYLTLSFIVHRTKLKGRKFLGAIATLPLGVPGLVLGLGLLWTWIWLPIPLYGTIFILILANVVRFMPQGFQGMSSSMLQIHPELEESALVSGAGRLKTVRFVTLPLIKTGIFGTLLLILILAFRELTVALFLFTADTRVISIVLFNYWETGQAQNAAVVAVVECLILIPIVILGRRFLNTADQR